MNVQFGNQELEGQDKLAYNFSQQSYKKANERTNIGDYEYDPSLSNVDTAVWHNKKNKKTHVSNRGSTSAYDWLVSDEQIATGTEDRARGSSVLWTLPRRLTTSTATMCLPRGIRSVERHPHTPRRSSGTNSGTMVALASIRATLHLAETQCGQSNDVSAKATTPLCTATSKQTSKNAVITCLQRT